MGSTIQSNSETPLKKTALITGASRGIGRAIAVALAKEGYDLFLLCRKNMDTLTQMAKELQMQYAVQVTCFQGDAGDAKFVRACFEHISDLTVLINNAGISHVGLLQDMTDEEWDTLLQTNLSSMFYCCRCAIPLMLKQHSGHIINISSVWGSQGASMEVAYSASKGGVNAFTRALAKELAPSGLQVNAIAPGFIDTEMNAHLSPEELASLFEEIPAGRAGQPKEVAQLVLQLLASPTYLTGQIITLDGGWT